MTPSYRVVGLFSRQAGLSVLNTLFTPDSEFELVCLFTNRREPSAVDPARPNRPEYPDFQRIATERGIPFYTVDTYHEARNMVGLRDHLPIDFIFSVSWAFLVPPDVLALPRIAAINQHRGKLPDYPLASPVVKALQNGDDTIILTTHLMNEAYDEGKILLETPLPARYDKAQPLIENVQRIKQELLPLYPRALQEAVQTILAEKNKR